MENPSEQSEQNFKILIAFFEHQIIHIDQRTIELEDI